MGIKVECEKCESHRISFRVAGTRYHVTLILKCADCGESKVIELT